MIPGQGTNPANFVVQPKKRDERARNSLDKVAPRNAGAGGRQKGSGVVGTDMPRTFFRKGRRIPVTA